MNKKISKKGAVLFLCSVLSVFFLCILLLAGTSSASDYEVVQSDTLHFELKPGAMLEMKMGTGDLIVNVWNKQSISIRVKKWAKGSNRNKAEKKLNNLEVEFDYRNDGLLIHELGRGESNLFTGLLKSTGLKKAPSTRIDFDLSVPSSIMVKLTKQDGNIRLDGIRGDVKIEQKKGGLYLANIVADKIDLKLGDVAATISSLRGPNDADTFFNFKIDKGQIILENSNVLRLIARSNKADLYLVNNVIKSGDIETKTGDLFFNSDMPLKSQVKAFSDSGNMYLLLPGEPKSQITAETVLGVIRCAHEWDIKKGRDGSVLQHSNNGPDDGNYSFVAEVGDIFIQSKWQ